jgi:hypothetical protein
MGERAGGPFGQFPAGRYGHRRDPAYQRRRRWLVWLAGALVIVGGIAIAVKLYRQYDSPPYEVLNLSSAEIDDTGVTVDFDVRVPAGEGATCTVQGHTFEGRSVGSAQVDVPPAGADVTMLHVTYRLTTTERPMTGEVPGCGPRHA